MTVVYILLAIIIILQLQIYRKITSKYGANRFSDVFQDPSKSAPDKYIKYNGVVVPKETAERTEKLIDNAKASLKKANQDRGI